MQKQFRRDLSVYEIRNVNVLYNDKKHFVFTEDNIQKVPGVVIKTSHSQKWCMC